MASAALSLRSVISLLFCAFPVVARRLFPLRSLALGAARFPVSWHVWLRLGLILGALRSLPERIGRRLGAAGPNPDWSLDALLGGLFLGQAKRFEQSRLLARRQIPPLADPQTGDRKRPDPGPAQALDLDPRDLHDPPHEMKDALVHRNRDDDAVGRLSQEPHFLGDNSPAVDDDPASDSFELLWVRPVPGQDLVFLG